MNQKPLRTAVVGVGYLGDFHAQKYTQLPQTKLVAVCDQDLQRAQIMAQKHACLPVRDYQELAHQVDAVSIVVPTAHHFEAARYFLERGIHVLLEKPMTETCQQAQQLLDIAQKKPVVFQIGHLERFNPAFRWLHTQCIRPRFIDATRLTPFKKRCSDTSVVLDLMIHDIDLVLSLVPSTIVHIDARGTAVLSDQVDIANARITFADGCAANVTASRVSHTVERKLRVFGAHDYYALNLHQKTLAHCFKNPDGTPEITTETIHLEPTDALLDEIQAFVAAIQTGSQPQVSGQDGQRALETAIAISQIITRH